MQTAAPSDPAVSKALICIEQGDVSALGACLMEMGAATLSSVTLLDACFRHRQTECAEMVCNNLGDRGRETLAWHAANTGCERVLTALLPDADADQRGTLCYAAAKGNQEVCVQLIFDGYPQDVGQLWRFAVRGAIDGKHDELFERLLSKPWASQPEYASEALSIFGRQPDRLDVLMPLLLRHLPLDTLLGVLVDTTEWRRLEDMSTLVEIPESWCDRIIQEAWQHPRSVEKIARQKAVHTRRAEAAALREGLEGAGESQRPAPRL